MNGIGSLAGLGTLAALDVINLTNRSNPNTVKSSGLANIASPSSVVMIGTGHQSPSIIGLNGADAYAAVGKITDPVANFRFSDDYANGYNAGFQHAVELVKNLVDNDIIDTLLEELKNEQECRKK